MLKLFWFGVFVLEIFEFMNSTLLNIKLKVLVLILAYFSRKLRIVIGILLVVYLLINCFSLKNYLFYNAISSENLL